MARYCLAVAQLLLLQHTSAFVLLAEPSTLTPALQQRSLSSTSRASLQAPLRMVGTAAATKTDFREGEWAGWECRFSHTDGSRMRIPEEWVPESMQEWDVPVWGFEVLYSEQVRSGGGGRELYRKRAQVYPETGCALDDLAVALKTTTTPITNVPNDEPSFFLKFDGGYTIVAPTPFCGTHTVEVVIDKDDGEARVRCSAFVDAKTQSLSRPVTVAKERRIGDFDDGQLHYSGLDIRALTEAIGAPCFGEAEEPPKLLAPEDSPECPQGVTLLALRGGVVVRTGPWLAMQDQADTSRSTASGDELQWALSVGVPLPGYGRTVVVAFTEDGVPHVVSSTGLSIAAVPA